MRAARFTWTNLLAVASVVVFVVLAVVASAGHVNGLDQDLRQVFRPDDVWGIWQQIFGNVVDGAAPEVALVVFALVAALTAVRRRSWRPLVFAGILALAAVVITQVAKAIVARPDPQGHVGSFSGSFPSGHMVILLTCLGGVLLLWRERPPAWAWWVAVVAELTMGLSLLLLSMHWFTDVIGGLLLAVPLLVVAASPRFLTPVHRTAPHSVGSLS